MYYNGLPACCDIEYKECRCAVVKHGVYNSTTPLRHVVTNAMASACDQIVVHDMCNMSCVLCHMSSVFCHARCQTSDVGCQLSGQLQRVRLKGAWASPDCALAAQLPVAMKAGQLPQGQPQGSAGQGAGRQTRCGKGRRGGESRGEQRPGVAKEGGGGEKGRGSGNGGVLAADAR